MLVGHRTFKERQEAQPRQVHMHRQGHTHIEEQLCSPSGECHGSENNLTGGGSSELENETFEPTVTSFASKIRERIVVDIPNEASHSDAHVPLTAVSGGMRSGSKQKLLHEGIRPPIEASYLMQFFNAIHPAKVFSVNTLLGFGGCAMAAALGASLAVDIHFIC
jgi:hypothetical protein